MSRSASTSVSILLALAGAASADVLNVPADYPTIQAAIDAATDGDVVLVADDTYTGDGNRDLDFGGKAITVEGNAGDPSLCVIDVDADKIDPHRAFRFHAGEGADSVVRGFTIRDGFMDRGGAVVCENGAAPLFESCVFEHNTALTDTTLDGGGAVHVGGFCSPTFVECQFLDNTVQSLINDAPGGAMLALFDSSVTLIDCLFEANSAVDDVAGYGGAISALGDLTLTDCTFTANSGPAGGGAVIAGFGIVTQTGCTYAGNSAEFGGAVWDSQNVATYTDCTFDANYTVDTLGDNSGGAYIANNGTFVEMTGCVFSNNTSPSSGGGIGINNATVSLTGCEFIGNEAQQGAGVFVNAFSYLTVNGCRFEDNTAGIAGGGLQVILNSEAAIDSTVFLGNIATGGVGAGGGVVIGFNASATITNVLFAGNQAAGSGGGLWVGANDGQSADATVVNSTFFGNIAVSGGGLVAQNYSDVTVANSIFWDNDAANQIDVGALGEATVSYSDIQGGWNGQGTNNIDCDPLFADPAAGDFHPLAPCVIDSGDNCPVPDGIDTDLDANPRLVDYPGAANVGNDCQSLVKLVDMGAYERQCPPDCNADGSLNILDFVCYQILFQTADPAADCNADAVLNILDFVCFQSQFVAGCP